MVTLELGTLGDNLGFGYLTGVPILLISWIYKSVYCQGTHLFWFWRDSGVSLKGQISRLPEQPCWLYALIALQQHSPLRSRFYPSGNWLSSTCLTTVIAIRVPILYPLFSVIPVLCLLVSYRSIESIFKPNKRLLLSSSLTPNDVP